MVKHNYTMFQQCFDFFFFRVYLISAYYTPARMGENMIKRIRVFSLVSIDCSLLLTNALSFCYFYNFLHTLLLKYKLELCQSPSMKSEIQVIN